MYTNQVIPYYRAPHILLGFPTRYVDRPLTEHVKTIDPVGLRGRLLETYLRCGTDLTDGVFMTSRDGLVFHRWLGTQLPSGEAERWLTEHLPIIFGRS